MDDSFGHWLAGFTDGEGCFYIRPTGASGGFVCQFTIGLRRDDQPVLDEIVARTGLGDVRVVNGERTQQVRWEITRKADCAALVALFDKYPLRAKKARDLLTWREAVAEWCKPRPRRPGYDWSRMAELKEAMAERRVCRAL